MKFQSHPFHFVDSSPWPLVSSLALFISSIGGAAKIHGYNEKTLIIGIITLLISMYLWWKDVIAESTYQGNHTEKVENGIRIGFILFVITEIFFFISIFWAYLHSALSPTVFLGVSWPPKGIEAINPWELPLLNTLILLSSGATVTWSHYSLISGNKKNTIIALILTIFLALLFTIFQGLEYNLAPFTFADSVFGSTFYFGTSFHGGHIFIGTIFLIVCLYRIFKNQFSNHHHLGFELAIIYWHFVDIVWLFLFIIFYWWGS